MTNQAMAKEILVKALEAAEKSMRYFDWMNEEEEGTELESVYWANVREYDGKAEAYLDCYGMITGRKVINVRSAIKEECEIMFVF